MADPRQPPVAPVEHFNEKEHRRLLANRANAALAPVITSLLAGQKLIWDGEAWINQTDPAFITNANGTAWRWESGLQVCLSRELTTTGATQSSFSRWISSSSERATWTFPAAFSVAPNHIEAGRRGVTVETIRAFMASTTSVTLGSVHAQSVATSSTDIYAIAMGFWK